MSKSLKAVTTVETAGRTFSGIQTEFNALLMDGEAIICPCCQQHAMICKRKITDTMARQLRRIVTHNGSMGSCEIQQGTNGRERMYSLLRFWGLLSPEEKDQWVATPLGREFVEGEACVPKYTYIYNNGAVKFSEELVTFEECLKAPFSLPEVFSATSVELHEGAHAISVSG